MIEETHPAGRPADSPVDDDAPTEDRIHTAVLAIITGVVAAVAWFAVLTWIQTRLLARVTANDIQHVNPHAFYVNFIVYGALLGGAFAAGVAWFLMFPIPSSYRRGGLSLVSAFIGLVVGGAATAAVRALLGPALLPVLAVMSILVAIWLGRRTVASVQ